MNNKYFNGFLYILGVIGWFFVFNNLLVNGSIGGMFIWAAIGSMIAVVILSKVFQIIFEQVFYRNRCKYGNVKVGDCLK